MADVVARVEFDDLPADDGSYMVHPLGSGWLLEIEGTPGVWVEQFVDTEAEAHLRAAELAILMGHG